MIEKQCSLLKYSLVSAAEAGHHQTGEDENILLSGKPDDSVPNLPLTTGKLT